MDCGGTQKDNVACSTMKILSDYWAIRIIDELAQGEKRFCGIKHTIENINAVTLTDRLKKLEDIGLISRAEETEDKQSVTYSLTPLGQAAIPFVQELKAFLKKARR